MIEKLDWRAWAVVSTALLLTWLGVNVAWGLTGPDDTLVSGWLRSLAPLGSWAVGIGASLIALSFALSRSSVQGAANIRFITILLIVYVGGVLGFEALYAAVRPRLGGTGVPVDQYSDAFRFVLHRSFYGMPAIPMALVWWAQRRRAGYASPFCFGDWRSETRLKLASRGPLRWRGAFVLFVVVLVLPAFLVFQAQVGFKPLSSGVLIRFLPALLLMAIANGVFEEIIFRGLLLSSLIPLTGPRAAVWIQALFFGLHHFGASPVPASGLAVGAMGAIVGYVWGRSVVGTKGLGWAILTHMLADLAFFSVTHVAF